jgi:hypothetical protein
MLLDKDRNNLVLHPHALHTAKDVCKREATLDMKPYVPLYEIRACHGNILHSAGRPRDGPYIGIELSCGGKCGENYSTVHYS